MHIPVYIATHLMAMHIARVRLEQHIEVIATLPDDKTPSDAPNILLEL